MKSALAINLSLAAVLSAGMAAAAQGPGDGPGPGAPEPGGPGMGMGMHGPGFGMHRPPMERALGLREGRWWNNPSLVEKLKLTDDQRKAMDQILLDHRKDLIDKRATLEKAEVDLEPLMQDDQPNESKVLAQIDKVAQARAELEKANARFLLALRARLSAEQWKQLKAERSERMDRRLWRQPRDGGRPPAPPAPPPPAPQGLLNELPAPDVPTQAPAK
jgi:Spy/CpxP family protein refolding chaperone